MFYTASSTPRPSDSGKRERKEAAPVSFLGSRPWKGNGSSVRRAAMAGNKAGTGSRRAGDRRRLGGAQLEEEGGWPDSRERAVTLGSGFREEGDKAVTLGSGFREEGDKAVTVGLGLGFKGDEMLSREEMLWFQACWRSTGMILVASTETQGGREPAPAFQGRKRSPQVGEAREGLPLVSRAAGPAHKEEAAWKELRLAIEGRDDLEEERREEEERKEEEEGREEEERRRRGGRGGEEEGERREEEEGGEEERRRRRREKGGGRRRREGGGRRGVRVSLTPYRQKAVQKAFHKVPTTAYRMMAPRLSKKRREGMK
ncbi:hypothetical protein CRUP_017456 [Coryphaenoides rupestris]|nr:hypothetical protein CRUP_017456 [Coryphaenoides rupestris]